MKKVISSRVAEKSLGKKGFEKSERDHRYYFFWYCGKVTSIFTYFSRSPKHKDISEDLLEKMKRELRLDTISEAYRLLKCPMSKDEYCQKVKNKGLF